jgi:hypothetical protein
MSLETFLLYKKNMNNILGYTEIIISSFDEILSALNNILITNKIPDNNIICEIVKIKEIKNTYIKNKNEIEIDIENCDCEIYKICNHDYIEDYIDITPDISQKICYCSICELSKK